MLSIVFMVLALFLSLFIANIVFVLAMKYFTLVRMMLRHLLTLLRITIINILDEEGLL